MTHWPTLAIADFLTLLGMLSGGLFTIFKFIQKIRTNDIHHLDEKIDEHHQNIMTVLERTENKLDGHLRDHAMGAFHDSH